MVLYILSFHKILFHSPPPFHSINLFFCVKYTTANFRHLFWSHRQNNIILGWEPSAAKFTKSYSRRLPERFYFIFYWRRPSQFRMSKPNKEHSREFSEFPNNQNLREIGHGVLELWSEKTGRNRDYNFIYIDIYLVIFKTWQNSFFPPYFLNQLIIEWYVWPFYLCPCKTKEIRHILIQKTTFFSNCCLD